MIFYLGFRETHEQVVAENETLRRKLEESQMAREQSGGFPNDV
jgi:hypothetical protein